MLKETASYVGHAELVSFADRVVNLKREDVSHLRDQVNRLRDSLAEYIAEHPAYSLVKMLHSGSVAKGTALSDLNDMDVAVYVKKEAVKNERNLISWTRDRLQEALWRLKPGQFQLQTHCVKTQFVGTGLCVDVVPVIYEGMDDDRGYLIVKDTGERVLTSIPLHLEFIRERKRTNPTHYTQIVRFIKWWANQQKLSIGDEFRFKSFVAELLVAKLADGGLELDDYSEALERVFSYIVKSGLRERIAFTDHYPSSALPTKKSGEIEIFDPVNPENNVTAKYTADQRAKIVEKGHDALDAIQYARYATTKQIATDAWKTVFGPAFRIY